MLPFSPCMCVADHIRFQLNSRTVLAFPNKLATYTQARQRCFTEGGELFGAYSSTENTAIVNAFSNYSAPTAWIGLMSVDGVATTDRSKWAWLSTKQTPSYSLWATDEPNNSGGGQGVCGQMVLKDGWTAKGNWDDDACDVQKAFACEIGECTCKYTASSSSCAGCQ